MSESNSDEAISQEEFNLQLKEIFTKMVNRARAEAKTTPAWQGLWEASEGGLQSTLNEANHQIRQIIMNLSDVIKTRFEIESLNQELYDLLYLMPYAMNKLKEAIREEEGHTCCADKTRHTYYLMVLDEINKLRKRSEVGEDSVSKTDAV